MPLSPARAAAFDILLRVETTDAYASELLHSSRVAKLSPADHGLATEIVMGVLRWRSALDKQIGVQIDKTLTKLDAEVIAALRIGAYQLLFLDRIPEHAAINESVELVKKARKRSAAGMVNAVLRKMHSQPSKRSSRATSDARNDNVLASHPGWLVERWERTYGVAAAQAICAYGQHSPITGLRATDKRVLEELDLEIRLEPGKLLNNAYAVTRGDITRTHAFRERQLIIQDEGSQLVALLLGRGDRILDCCAAPGGKTRILAEQNPNAIVLAMELHPHRAMLTRRLVPLPKVHVLAADARSMPFAGHFDRILVDAPCTGTGTLARNPEIKWRLSQEDIVRIRAYQLDILSVALECVALGGRLLYSTCSLEPEENEAVVEELMNAKSGFRVLNLRAHLNDLQREGTLVWSDIDSLLHGPFLRTVPGVHPCDGFFAALIEREM